MVVFSFFFFITEDLIDPEILVFVSLDNFFIFVKEWTGVLSVDYPLLVALNVLLWAKIYYSWNIDVSDNAEEWHTVLELYACDLWAMEGSSASYVMN